MITYFLSFSKILKAVVFNAKIIVLMSRFAIGWNVRHRGKREGVMFVLEYSYEQSPNELIT